MSMNVDTGRKPPQRDGFLGDGIFIWREKKKTSRAEPSRLGARA
jgi:hypothetical protein